MRPIITSFIIALLLLSCSTANERDDLYVVRQAAEFEPQDAIWLIWPSTNHKQGESVEKVTLSIIEALIGEIKIVVTCRNKELLSPCERNTKEAFRRIKEPHNSGTSIL